MAKAVSAEPIVFIEPANDTVELYRVVHQAAKDSGKEKAFLEAFGTEEEFLARCGVDSLKGTKRNNAGGETLG